MTGATNQKEFSIEYMFKKQKLLFISEKTCVKTTKTSK